MSARESLLARCESLVPALEARAADAERLRRLPDATIADAAASGLFSMLVPVARGGAGLGLTDIAQATRILAHGCVSSAWTLSFFALHNWLLGRFDARLQDELFAGRPWTLVPAPLAPTGTLRVEDGGYRVSGRWEWATGVMHADWVMVHALGTGERGPLTRFCLVPVAAARIEDVWLTSGMRATGSNTVVLDDVFVPTHRTLEGRALMQSSGCALEFARYPTLPVLAFVAAAPALGAAERAVELFRTRVRERVLTYSLGERQIDQPAAQIRLSAALATVRAARASWEAAMTAFDAAAASVAGPRPLDRAAARLAAAHTVRLAREAIGIVCAGAGASVYFEASPLQRLQRDVEVLKGHVVFDWDRTAELVGRLELGFEPRPTDML
ncbi:MAG: acyl-CoA dehydrogenase family protein [Deltaproteobacteria bacterium]|nr:acyl-CoA dehydrogenase family protein [Deltaproteobacteria bacterium]